MWKKSLFCFFRFLIFKLFLSEIILRFLRKHVFVPTGPVAHHPHRINVKENSDPYVGFGWSRVYYVWIPFLTNQHSGRLLSLGVAGRFAHLGAIHLPSNWEFCPHQSRRMIAKNSRPVALRPLFYFKKYAILWNLVKLYDEIDCSKNIQKFFYNKSMVNSCQL